MFDWEIKPKEFILDVESSHWFVDFDEDYDESTEYVLPYLSEDWLSDLPDIFYLTYEHYYKDELCEEEPIVQGSGNYKTVAIFTLKEKYANNYILKLTYDSEEVEEIYLVWVLY